MFFKIGVLINFAKFTGNACARVSAGSVTLLKKRLRRRCFPVNFAKFIRTPFLKRTPLVAASARITNKQYYSKETPTQVFPGDIVKIFRKPFF